jgi:hypothetical protein
MINPPHKPCIVGERLGLLKFLLVISCIEISSATDVKMIGKSGVPIAIIFAPLAINSAEAFAPVPVCPLIIVPASIAKVAPSVTVILPDSS